MSWITWDSPDVVLTCQLVSATALVVHLLILRPRGARQDLLLDAMIVADELDLAERLGQIAADNVETVALQQLLRRVRQNPRSAALVLERIPELARAARLSRPPADRPTDVRSPELKPTDVEYLGGALDRLSDAAQRYLRGAWPRAGALSSTIITTSSTIWGFDGINLDRDAPDPYNLTDVLYLTDDDLDDQPSDDTSSKNGTTADGTTADETAKDETTTDETTTDETAEDETAEDGADDELEDEVHRGPLDSGLDPERDLDADLDGNEPGWTPAEGPDLSDDGPDDDRSPSWIDLVKAETPRRTSGLGLADRHARPFRPSRSTGRPSSRRADPDRASVLPR